LLDPFCRLFCAAPDDIELLGYDPDYPNLFNEEIAPVNVALHDEYEGLLHAGVNEMT
jgi:hypothetical protein